ncbi:carbohydrate ABC transporter permease [Breznakiella homolactica]|uniref:Maltose/maltodextrin transport system permease protein MalG n=1 Tax=Breznakiella homolactica TaxID=2798577 RepID=A0A7T8BD05_9SPIR|nr:carbohydrate ABC transporter permease [Breznakiella homolactica]QQO10773.1 carbohydrate ABC transporter permease [Breznakiella homolactica]
MATVDSKKNTMITRIVIVFFYILVIFVFGGPVLWLVSLSFRTPQQLFTNPPQLFPNPISFEAYKYIFRGSEVFGFLKNSVLLSLYTCLGCLIIAIPGSYALSRFRMKFKKQIMIIILLFKMISPMIIIIPMYRYFTKIGLLGTHLSTALVYIAAQIPFITYLLKGFFDSVPYSIEESAMIDGCSRIQSLLRIVLPISASGIFSAFIFTFLMSWSEFLIPFILLSSTKQMPMSVGIYLYQESRATVDTHIVSAITVVTIIPPILIFWLLQRYVVQVLTSGAVKE